MALPTLLLTSCLKDQEDVFDKPSATRISEYLANTANVLKASANGWVLYYYPDNEQSYGGYAYTLKFDGEDVVVGLEQEEGTVTSKYKLVADDGPVLTFDTYNDLMHGFATPSSGRYEAMGGDFEFIILSASAEKVELKGKRSGNVMTMYPLETSAESFLESLAEVQADMAYANFTMSVDTVNVPVYVSSRNMVMEYPAADENGTPEVVTAPFVYTLKGIEFYEPVELNGQTISGFKYEAGATSYASFESSSVVLNGVIPPINETFVSSLWSVTLKNMSAFGAPYWEWIRDVALPAVQDADLDYAYIGGNNGATGFWFSSGGYTGVLGLDYELEGDDIVKIAYNKAKNQGNGDWYVANGYYHRLILPFGCNDSAEPLQRTFKITADNVKAPSILVLADQDNDQNVITLSAEDLKPFE